MLQLGLTNSVPANPFILNGGTFSSGSPTGNSAAIGYLELQENSFLELGGGNHTLAFAASDAIPWTAGKMLTITGWQGDMQCSTPGTEGRIFLGSSASGLTVTQLAQVQFYHAGNYYPATLLSDGELVPRDTELPTALCQDITVGLDAGGNASITASQVDNGSLDNCGIASMSVSPNAFGCAEIGANTVTLTVTDVNNNVATCNATVTVTDPLGICNLPTVPTAELRDSQGNLLAGSSLQYYASGWKPFGTTGDDGLGTCAKELLPISYSFKMTYNGITNQISNHNTSTYPVVTFYETNYKFAPDEPGDAETEYQFTARAAPNPFSSATDIYFNLQAEQMISLNVYDIMGAFIETIYSGLLSEGDHKQTWKGQNDRGQDMPNGVYFIRLIANERIIILKMVKS